MARVSSDYTLPITPGRWLKPGDESGGMCWQNATKPVYTQQKLESKMDSVRMES
jgi:hypothetical protein